MPGSAASGGMGPNANVAGDGPPGGLGGSSSAGAGGNGGTGALGVTGASGGVGGTMGAGSNSMTGGTSGSGDGPDAGGSASDEGSGGNAGSAGTGGDGGVAGSRAGGDGGVAGSGEPTSYPMLQAAQIGDPVVVATGFTLAESPLWDPCGHQLLFTDVQGGVGSRGVIHALDADEQVTTFASRTDNANGIAFDIDGSLILSQMGGGGHLARRDHQGNITTIEPDGSPALHTPDDVIVRSDGTIYFSDGDFYPIGSLFGYLARLPVYMLAPGASELVSVVTVAGPNGVELSPDEKTLYVNAFGEGALIPCAVADDGTLTKGEPLVSGLTQPDSLCLDAAGNLYVGVQTGLQVLRPDGSEIKLIPIPGGSATQGTTSCNFGADDGKTLYITSFTTLYRVDDMPIPGQDWLVNQQRVACN